MGAVEAAVPPVPMQVLAADWGASGHRWGWWDHEMLLLEKSCSENCLNSSELMQSHF